MRRRHPDFLKLWIGQAISQMGSRVTREGLPLTAVLVLGATPFQMGLLNGFGAFSILTFGLFAGAWADRLRRRPILIWTDFGRALLLGSIPIAALLHSLTMTHLYCVAAAAGLLTILFDVSYQAYVPLLAEKGNLLDLNSKLALSESVAEVAGPGVTGLLVQWLTAPIAIAVDAASYLVSTASLLFIRIAEPPPDRSHGDPQILREIIEGLRTSWENPVLRALLARTATMAFFGGITGSMYVLFAIRVLRLSPALLGGIISIGGVAAVCGTFVTGPITRRFGIGPTLIGAAVLTGTAALLNPMARGPLPMAALFLPAAQVNDIGWTVYSVNELSLRQSIVHPRLLGRVNSATQLLFRGLIPLGALVGGVLAQACGIRTAMWIGAGGFFLSPIWLIRSPLVYLRKLPEPIVQ